MSVELGGERFLKIANYYLPDALLSFHRNPDGHEKYFKDVPFIREMRQQADAYYDRLLEQEP